jgi:ribosomal protein S12 methylthiotransferase accessory factor
MYQQIEQLGFDVFVADYCQHSLYVCRILIPGMSEVYPHEELSQNNQNIGRTLRLALQALDPDNLESLEQTLEVIDALGFSDHQNVANAIGLHAESDDFWGGVNMIQLKFWLLLAMQEWEEAYEALQTSQSYLSSDTLFFKEYKVFAYIFECMSQYNWQGEAFVDNSGWEILFDAEVVAIVMNHLHAEEVLMGAATGQEIFNQAKHQKLLEIYQQLRTFK